MFQKKKVLNLTFIKGYSAGVFSDSDLLDKQCTELSDVLLVIMTISRIHVFFFSKNVSRRHSSVILGMRINGIKVYSCSEKLVSLFVGSSASEELLIFI